MTVRTLVREGSLSVIDYRCTAQPTDRPFPEQHTSFSLSYVRRGSFGCRAHGQSFELVAGSLLVGYPGDEYTCLHDHHAHGDECLCFSLTPTLLDAIDSRPEIWRVASLPPLPDLVVLGELAQVAADGGSDLSLDEIGMLLISRFIEVVTGRSGEQSAVTDRDRRRAVDAAHWIDGHADEPIALRDAASTVGLSEFHFLRLFRAVLGLTPHQHLVRCRLRRAARLLCDEARSITDVAFESGFGDLSNFIRTFRRAARVSPRTFRKLADRRHGELKRQLARASQLSPAPEPAAA